MKNFWTQSKGNCHKRWNLTLRKDKGGRRNILNYMGTLQLPLYLRGVGGSVIFHFLFIRVTQEPVGFEPTTSPSIALSTYIAVCAPTEKSNIR